MTAQKTAPPITVLVNGRKREDAVVTSVLRVMGGRKLNSAVFEAEKSGFQRDFSWIDDGVLIEEVGGEEVEIIVETSPRKVVHWGFLYEVQIRSDDGEQLEFESRLEPHNFGEPLTTTWTARERLAGKPAGAVQADIEMVMNPLVDGRPVPNMTLDAPKLAVGVKRKDVRLFFSQSQQNRELLATHLADAYSKMGTSGYAEVVKKLTVDFWNLTDAVYYLLAFHADSAKFTVPSRKALLKIFGDDPTLLRNHRLDRGEFLPKLLDDLITPFGYSWYVDFPKPGVRTIKFVKRNDSDIIRLPMAKVGSEISFDTTHVARIGCGVDISSKAFNDIVVRGDFPEREVTVVLVPAWKPEYDTIDASRLAKGSDETATDYQTKPELRRVWRDWVANEAGDYTGLRSWIKAPEWDDFFDGKLIERRRRAMPTITIDNEGKPFGDIQGAFVEFWDGYEWHAIGKLAGDSDLNVKLLRDEVGIRFDGQIIPPELLSRGIWGESAKFPVSLVPPGFSSPNSKAKLMPSPFEEKHLPIKSGARNTTGILFRMTCTLSGDQRIEHNEKPKFGIVRFATLLRQKKTLVVDAPSRFKSRKRTKWSVLNAPAYFGVVPGSLSSSVTYKKAEIDDLPSMKDIAKKTLDSANQGTFSGNLTLMGVDYAEMLGKSVQRITGRAIALRTTPLNSKSRYPTVVGVTYRPQEQETVLEMDTPREDFRI